MKIASIIITILFICASPAYSKIYKWTDTEGVEHYTTTPPKDTRGIREHIDNPTAKKKEMVQKGCLLELTSWAWRHEHGYAIVEGLVENIWDKKLKGVMAVAIFSDEDGTFIKSDYSVVEFNPLLPGQQSPFKIMSSWNPAMNKCRVQFKSILGPEIHAYRPQ